MIRSHDKDCFGTFVPRSLEVSASMITFVLINTFNYFAPSLSRFDSSISASLGRMPNKDFAVSTLS